MEMRESGKSLEGIAAGAKPLGDSPAPRRDQLDPECCSMGLAMVSRLVSRSEEMEQGRAAV